MLFSIPEVEENPKMLTHWKWLLVNLWFIFCRLTNCVISKAALVKQLSLISKRMMVWYLYSLWIAVFFFVPCCKDSNYSSLSRTVSHIPSKKTAYLSISITIREGVISYMLSLHPKHTALSVLEWWLTCFQNAKWDWGIRWTSNPIKKSPTPHWWCIWLGG